MSEAAAPASAPPASSPLRVGALLALAGLAFYLVVAVIAVLEEDDAGAAVGGGAVLAVVAFALGATVAVGLACLRRERLRLIGLVAVGAAVVALDLIGLAVWLDIGAEWYGKLLLVLVIWAFFLFLVLSLDMATGEAQNLTRALVLVSSGAFLVAAVVLTRIALTTGDSVLGLDAEGALDVGDAELRLLGVALVVGAASWFAGLAASRFEGSAG